jgi:hypothetical protein
MPKSRVQVATHRQTELYKERRNCRPNLVDDSEVLDLGYYRILGLHSYSAGAIRLRSLVPSQIVYSLTGYDL